MFGMLMGVRVWVTLKAILRYYVQLAGQTNEKVKFPRHLKDNTDFKLPSKWNGLKRNITTISGRIDLSDCNRLSYSLIFKTYYRMVERFVVHKDSINLILAIASSGLLM